ncbi:MAG: hypothetical protein JO024_04065 [Candidatus Eremiobacteraeota bacterium]|nr:hypothetical protein [Candidatus Eremiobacteraeota bacterium]MBV9737842.1 hypothetical protein [Candidatus Eremiobacteraeota bacterium]
MKNRLLTVASSVAIALCGCEARPPSTQPANFTVSANMPSPWPSAVVAAASAPPRILGIWLSSLTIAPGSTLDGAIATTTNVASVEVRTAAFSINSLHVAPGQFRFHTRVLELPPLARLHTYTLDVIARNTAGVAQVEQASLAMK